MRSALVSRRSKSPARNKNTSVDHHPRIAGSREDCGKQNKPCPLLFFPREMVASFSEPGSLLVIMLPAMDVSREARLRPVPGSIK